MGFQLTDQVIRALCGRFSYERGELYYRDGKVKLNEVDPGSGYIAASVSGKSAYQASVRFDPNGTATAECTCPAFDPFDKYCEHVAAALLYYSAWQNDEEGHRDEDEQLSEGFLHLFADKPKRPIAARPLFDARERLAVEFVCRVLPYNNGKYMFGVEMKVGVKRLHSVAKIREFLEKAERRESVRLAKNFTYDPDLHCFFQADEAIIAQLIQACRNERMYRDSKDDRVLQMPSFSWDVLLPLLENAPSAKLEAPDGMFDGIQVADEPMPLSFAFDEDKVEGGYRLDVQGLDAIVVMEMYGIVIFDGKLLKLPDGQISRLAQLKRMLNRSSQTAIRIPPERMEPYMEQVVPGLMKLGNVKISEAVSDRMVRMPLSAKLYLDRVRDKLLAGLEFHYGEIVINPLEGANGHLGSERILLRDSERERRILELMEQSAFGKTESGYFMEGEDAEFDFLHQVVPELEKYLRVYATSAVKTKLHTGSVHPKVKVDVDERTDWLDFKFEMDGIPDSEIRGVLKSLDEKRRYHRLANGALLPMDSEEFQAIIRMLNETGVRFEHWHGAEARLPLFRGLSLMEYHRQEKGVSLGKSFRKLLENMRNPDNQEFHLPVRLVPVLRDYQKEGFQWMRTLARYRFGGILADDMGLGKTIQSIAFIVSLLADIHEMEQPALIVAPASLVYNWRNELQKFAPELRAVIADGSREERVSILRRSGFEADVIITSYPLLRRDIDLYAGRPFHTLILDEAQAFKNHATQTSQAVREIKALHRFALTGTPVENRLEELWSIIDAVFPELFEGRKAFNELPRETVAKRIRPFLLRRLKADVLQELPDKIESLQASELLPEQKKLYVAYMAQLRQETIKHLSVNDFQNQRIKILAGLTRLRQICCHPALFVEGYEGSSAKFEQLLEMIEECRSAGKRPLVFSQFTGMLGMIGRELGYRGIPHFYLDGQTPADERVELCTRFNEGEKDLFLLSLKAGGTGLNLTGADTVILYDLWWNPAVEQQATDRAHRIGQKNVVQVIRLVAQGTVEDKMYELQQRKLNLIEEVIRPGQESLSSLTERDIREILMIE